MEPVRCGTTAAPSPSSPPTRCHPRLAAPSRAWSVFQQLFAAHWEPFPHAHARYQAPYDAGLVATMLACGTPEKIGYSAYRCLRCGPGTPLGARSWKASLCWRCAQVHGDNGVRQVSQVLHEGGIDRHISLTVPAMFRTPCYQNAAIVVRAFIGGGAPCLDDFYREVRGKALRGGDIVVLHTQGRHGPYHPHLHVLATRGG